MTLEDVIFLESPNHSGEYLIIAVKGTVLDFRYSRVEYVDQFSPLAESYLMYCMDSLTDQTVVIHSAMTCGIPSERVSWTSPAGTKYRIHFSADGVGNPMEWHFTMD